MFEARKPDYSAPDPIIMPHNNENSWTKFQKDNTILDEILSDGCFFVALWVTSHQPLLCSVFGAFFRAVYVVNSNVSKSPCI